MFAVLFTQNNLESVTICVIVRTKPVVHFGYVDSWLKVVHVITSPISHTYFS